MDTIWIVTGPNFLPPGVKEGKFIGLDHLPSTLEPVSPFFSRRVEPEVEYEFLRPM